MKVSKWVDFGQEVEIDIGVEDIRGALGEAFANVTEDRLGEERANRQDVLVVFNRIAQFFNALTDEHIRLLNDAQRATIGKFLDEQAKRFGAAPDAGKEGERRC